MLIEEKHEDATKDVESKIGAAADTDHYIHYMVMVGLIITVLISKKTNEERIQRYNIQLLQLEN